MGHNKASNTNGDKHAMQGALGTWPKALFENKMFSMTNAVAEIADIELGLFAATSRRGATLATGRRRSANGNMSKRKPGHPGI